MKQQIIFDNIIFSRQKAGGISVYWAELLKHILNDSNFEAILLEYPDADTNIFRKEIGSDAHVHLINSHLPLQIQRFAPVRIPDFVSKDAIFHSSYYRIPSKHIKNVATVHDWVYAKFTSGIKKIIHVKQQINAVKRANNIICVSESTKKDTLIYCPECKNKPISVIYHGYDTIYHPLTVNRGNSILYIGDRRGYKNFNSVVMAITNINNLTLNIVGPPLSITEKQFLNTYISGRYFYCGHMQNIELNQLYNESAMLIYPSSYEGFGIPLLEAMAAGCPIITTRCSSIPEVVGDCALLLDEPNDINIANAINKMLLDNRLRNKLKETGIRRAKEFSWDKMYEATAKVYLNLADKNNE